MGFRFDVINNIDKRVFADSPDGLGKNNLIGDQPKVHKYLLMKSTPVHLTSSWLWLRLEKCQPISVENCIGYTNPQNKELDMVFSFHHLKVDYKE